MKLFLSPFTNPKLNLALEEYILDNFTDDDISMLWRNKSSVIIGKNQNAYDEIDMDYVQKNGVTVVRRITGGGAVFHDLGNINFTFVSDYREGDFGSYKLFAQPVCDYLKTLGLSAEVSGRNDILANGLKISGNAQTVRKNRILQHGTLLYTSDLSALSKALKPNELKLKSKAIASVRGRVENIKNLCSCSLSAEEFMQGLYDYMLSKKAAEKGEFSEKDINEAKKLQIKKYESFEWNFGMSPSFSAVRRLHTAAGNLEVHLDIKDAKIADIVIYGDFFGIIPINELCNKLKGCAYLKTELKERLKNVNIHSYISGISLNEFISLLI